ncbi:Hypothetical protein PHPALM_13419 [Phytophthora palmivora]|uniref:Cell division control protein 24 OB domain-containing protein n=1 Tax=Phytophthora palmivora TaxID=4796 RepID=A0A2P4XX96_9STRA|nr:Hypothetical protein PHPALM_13419 [Phytophthora palmivora]
MELLDAIEEFERPVDPRRGHNASPQHDFDFVERQVSYVQQKLRELRQRKRRNGADIPCIPFYWVFSKLLRLIEEYPDGLTEAVVVTELAKLLNQKEAGDAGHEGGAPRKKRKIRDEEDMGDLLAEGEQEALQARITGYRNHRLTVEMENAKDVVVHIENDEKDTKLPFGQVSASEISFCRYVPVSDCSRGSIYQCKAVGEESNGYGTGERRRQAIPVYVATDCVDTASTT